MIEVSGVFFRVMFEGRGDPLGAVVNPEGRFHHDGQPALYASETREGAVVATLSYARRGDPPRVIYPLMLAARRLIDLRDPREAVHHELDPALASLRWQEDRASGRAPATWALSDAARAAGADGMLYASRKRPDLTHLVLFRWNQPGAASVSAPHAPLPISLP